MQGSFTSDSADKFFQLMREAGYETQEVPSGGELQNFSSQGARTGSALGDVWQGNIAEFGEVRGEYLDVVDFTRCERPDGSAYGTKGKCKKGSEVPLNDRKKALSKGSTPLDKAVYALKRIARRIEDPNYKPTNAEMERYGKLNLAVEEMKNQAKGKVTTKTPNTTFFQTKGKLDRAHEKIRSIYRSTTRPIEDKSQALRGLKDSILDAKDQLARLKGEESGWQKAKGALIGRGLFDQAKKDLQSTLTELIDKYQGEYDKFATRIRSEGGDSFTELVGTHDFTRCQRPDGSAYGTRGKCRKGTESAAAEKPKNADKVQSLRAGIQKTSDKIDKIVKSGGRVGLNDPLSKQLKQQVEELKKLRRFEPVSSDSLVAPVPPKPIKDPVPGILRSQAEVKKIIADRPETPNPIRNGAGQPLNLTIARVKALSDQDLESEWNRAKTKGRKDKLQVELDRREAAVKAAPKKETQSDRETRGEFARNAKDFQGRIKDIKDEIRRSADDPEMRKQIPTLMKQIKMWEGELESAKAGSVKPGKN